MEKVLHYAWKCRILPLRQLMTTDGREVEVVDPGMSNPNAGPDFFNAKIRIGDTMWAGNVEIHLRSSDWKRHGHHEDAAYDNVILHLVECADTQVYTLSGKELPQVEMPIPEQLRHGYEDLLATMDYPRCHRIIPRLPALLKHSWMDALLVERLKERSERVLQRLKDTRGDWNRTLLITLARSFGFGLNGDAFERWAGLLPLHATAKHRDNMLQVEAIFLGTAGLTGRSGGVEAEPLAREYAYLAHKFELAETMKEDDWRYMRTRPQNFPHVRIGQLAQIYQRGSAELSALLELEEIDGLRKCFALKGMSKATIDLLIINTVVPVFYAYGMQHNDERFEQRAIALLEQLRAEENYIMRQWRACGLTVDSAADSQALIQLKREYCDRKDCLRCRFGFEYMKLANDNGIRI